MCNNKDWQVRTSLLLGNEISEKISKGNILIVGIGGVGSFAAEYLCRAGFGNITLIDGDIVDTTNRNRQLPALNSTIGKRKVDVVADRLLDINPDINVTKYDEFLRDERIPEVLQSQNYDFVIDAIDSLSPKVHLILNSVELNINIVSSMGAGGKLDPSKVMVADISKSYNCGLAKAVRKRLHRRGINKGVKVVFSPEDKKGDSMHIDIPGQIKHSVGTISYLPSIFGIYCASEVIRYFYKF